MQFRPEIDGLRAFAVGSVILFHADLTIAGAALLPGGSYGVDVFFVISGYLISRLMFEEEAATGSVFSARCQASLSSSPILKS